MKKILLSLLTFAAGMCYAAEVQTSPDGQMSLNFDLQDGGVPVYSIDFKGKTVIIAIKF